MNFFTFLSPIIFCYFVCVKCYPSTDDSNPPENYGDSFEDNDLDPSEGPQPNKALWKYQSNEFIQFDVSLLHTLAKQNKDKNIVISPASIKSLLALLTVVYSNKTVNDIYSTQVSKREFGSESIPFLWNLQTLLQNNQTNITVESRNKIFQASDQTLDKTAVENAADIETLDFSSPRAADIINKWVNESTKGLIPSVVEEGDISSLTKLVLLNCVYLKAKWDITFDQSKTNTDCFYRSPNECHRLKFMNIKRNLKYIREADSAIFEIPFADPRYTITFILPQKFDDVYNVLGDLKRNNNLYKLFSELTLAEESEVTLMLPRTTIDFMDSDFINTLKKPVIKSFFGRNVKLDHMLQDHTLLSVDTLFHRARIVLNEDGAEAAAVSGGIEFRGLMLPLVVKVDHPFLFFLRDMDTGLILFEGVANSPDGTQ